ncbi:MAG: hypothetical protein U5R49_25240 [Deltaproteobacteria bacterium]|nr:hypothetical protein [Deltaproteobacteria bacterium]
MDSEYLEELDSLRGLGRFIGEAGCLAANPAYWKSGHVLLLYTIKIVHIFNEKHLNLDDLVITVNPKHVWFYEHIMLMQRIGREKPYKDVKGAPAIAMRLDIRTMKETYGRTYQGHPPLSNMYDFFFNSAPEGSSCLNRLELQ